MRVPIWGAALLLGLLVPGCFLCPKAEAIPVVELRDTPELAFETFRNALRAGTTDVLYRSFSEKFKEDHDVTKLALDGAYNTHRSDFDALLGFLDTVDFESVERRYATRNGSRYLVLKLVSGDRSGTFVLKDEPSWTAKLRFTGYDEVDQTTYRLKRGGFPEILRVEDGVLHVAPLDLSNDGLTEVSEVVGLNISHRWLLDSIEQLVNVGSLLESFRSQGTQ